MPKCRSLYFGHTTESVGNAFGDHSILLQKKTRPVQTQYTAQTKYFCGTFFSRTKPPFRQGKRYLRYQREFSHPYMFPAMGCWPPFPVLTRRVECSKPPEASVIIIMVHPDFMTEQRSVRPQYWRGCPTGNPNLSISHRTLGAEKARELFLPKGVIQQVLAYLAEDPHGPTRAILVFARPL